MLKLLRRRPEPLSDDFAAAVRALPVERLEALAEAHLDFSGSEDLERWLDGH